MFSHEQYDALRGRAALLDRRARGRTILTGADRRSYLHGLLTNDIAGLTAGAGCYAALLTPQGRMISDMRVSDLGDKLLIDLPAATADAVKQRLADFIFTEEVDVSDAGTSLTQFGIYGPAAVAVLATVLAPAGQTAAPGSREWLQGLPLFANTAAVYQEKPVYVVGSDDYGVAGFEVFLETPAAPALAGACRAAGATDVSPETAEVTRVEAGRPQFGIDMDEHTIPLEAGIEDRAISLTKGCYVGQEIIIRILHRGHGRVARRLVGLIGDLRAGVIARGQQLQADGRDVGVITSAVHSPRLDRPIALGYVHRDAAEPGRVLSIPGHDDGLRTVTIVSLPFVA